MGVRGAASTDDTESSFEPAERMIVADLRQLRTMASRLRCEIIDEVTPEAKTVAEVGDSLGVSPSRLYYHFRELTTAGLIHCVAPDGSARHRRYRAAAHYYQLSSQMLHPDGDLHGHAAGVEFVAGAIEYSARQLRRAFADGLIDQSTASFLVQRRTIRVSVDRAVAFRDQLMELARDFVAMDELDGELTVELALAMFPRTAAAGGTQAVSERTRRVQAQPSRRSQSQVRPSVDRKHPPAN